ncbi:MAG: DUF7916 family protein [Candidatus Asgardarchaeia archaeon]
MKLSDFIEKIKAEGMLIPRFVTKAFLAKMSGADCYELGDSGFNKQVVLPENIMAPSIAIRGAVFLIRTIETFGTFVFRNF